MFHIWLAPLLLAPAIANAQLIVGVDDATEGIWNMNPSNNSVQTFLPGHAGTSLATDEVNRILYFMSNTVQLWKWDYSTPGNTPVFIASLTSATSSPFISMNGIGFNSANGKLYSSRSLQSGSDPEGFYEIDPATGIATNRIATPAATYDWGGIDRDASTGRFFANGDPGVSGTSTPGIFEVNFTTNTFTQIAPYPAGATDMDGLAAGNGKIYMVEDRAVQAGGRIHVYNTITGSYEAPLMVPWFFTETFSGGTYSPTLAAALAQVPEPTTAGALAVGATALLARRRRKKTRRRAATLVAGAVAVGSVCATDANAQLVMATDGLNEGMYMTDLATVRPTNQFPLPANIATWQQIFAGRAIRGMAADEPNRMLYWLDQTVEGAQVASTLWKMSYDTLAPQRVGIVRNATSGFDMGFMGLAIDTVNQKMYGTYNIGGTPGEGIYEITNYLTPSGNSVSASPRLLYNTLPGGETAYDLSSLDYDPVTNKVYGINNDGDQLGRGLYSFDLAGGTIALIVKSPDYRRIENDFDGLATGGGKAFFTTDEEGFVYVYDFALSTFTDFLSPVLEGDLFGGAAYAPGLVPEPTALAALALPAIGLLRRRKRNSTNREINVSNFGLLGRRNMRHHHVCTVAALAVATGISSMALAAVEVKPIVLEGYNVPGVGNIQSGFGASETHAVNNSGRWVVESDTDNANTDTDGVIVTGTGFSLPPLTLLLRHQDAVTAPAGATISSFDSVTINNSGNSAYNHFLDFTTGGNDDSGVYFNNTLVIQESSFATASGLSADTPYIGFNDVKLNNNNQMMLMGNVDDSAIASTVDNVLVRIEPGTFAQTLYAKEGDSFFTFAATGFTTGVHSSAFNDSAQYLTSVDTADANTATDGAVIRFDGPSGHVVLAREGSPSAVAGRNWGTIFDVPLDMNNSGAWVMRGDLDGATTDDSLIVKNGTDVIAREGSSLASIGGVFTFTSFGTGGVAI
ncbi:MAG: PEP-CTERM sorting domain-containing protein, partial [Anaerolineae bacterium]|nr:PEP-CTERM sorting domain-containing protein [Phycisphaerae bacterium]